ncbi:MAG: DNA replication/repair protein RecF [Oligoflexia bacterium]|nr:DNA replication/repair protein RecF [Oligoflexia bacterium]
MRIQKLTLRNFRNVRDASFEPSPYLNFLVGKNGQGKTSFLEAIGYLATLRSFRGSKTQEVIRWDSQDAEVVCKLGLDSSDKEKWETLLKVSFTMTDSTRSRATKVAFINDKPYRSSTQYLSQRFGNFVLGFHSVVFNPSDHDLVRSDPATRRSYLDRVIAAEDVEYLKGLQRYQKVLDQRNAVLKNNERPLPELLSGFTEGLIHYGAQITYKRIQWIHRLEKILNNTMRQIAQNQPPLQLVYVSNWVPKMADLSKINDNLSAVHFAGHGAPPSLELLEHALRKKQVSLEAAEWKSGHSLVGPHRDDWTFLMGGQVLKGHGSQGEVRSALLALKLSEIELFRETTGHRPVFLLDDFSSELDQERRTFLLDFLSERDLQVFVTTTDEGLFPNKVREHSQRSYKRFWVTNGELKSDG